MDGANRLVGRGGDDEIYDWGQESVLVGGPGDDVLDAAAAPNTFLAGSGDDVIRSATLVADHLVDGGGGHDIGFVDPEDPVTGIEEFRTG
jgi:Ca2+-binding RTX toxin-like protein